MFYCDAVSWFVQKFVMNDTGTPVPGMPGMIYARNSSKFLPTWYLVPGKVGQSLLFVI